MNPSSGNEWGDKYGSDFLAHLEENQDWRTVEALWRLGSLTDLPAIADLMARSGDKQLALLLGVELAAARYAAHIPALPDSLHLYLPVVSEEIASRVLSRLNDEGKPLDPAYQQKHHLLAAWLMRQPGKELDELAIEVALGGHIYSDVSEPKAAALHRISQDGEVGARLVQELMAQRARWETAGGWSRTADVVSLIGSPKHRAEFIRVLTVHLLTLAQEGVTQPAPGFVALMERHGSKELATAFLGEQLSNTPGTAAAVRAVAQFSNPLAGC